MRFEFDNEGYVCCVLYGCTTGSCVEYSGLVPSEPEAYEDMDDWADNAQVQAYYLNDQGNLTYDAERAAALPAEDEVTYTPYTSDQVKALGIFDAVYPVGSLYLSMNDVNPSTLFGGSWEQIKDKFLLSAGSNYSGGSEGGSASYELKAEAHKHTIETYDNVKFVSAAVTSGSYDIPITGTSEAAGAINVSIPTLPPYLAVYVWKRTA